jgi:hypothetical protein
VSDDLDTAAGPRGNTLPAGLAAAEAKLRLRTSLDLAEIARLVLDAAVPGFADAAAVFASEQLIRAGEPVRSGRDGKVTARRLGSRLGHDSGHGTETAFPAGEVVAFDADSPYGRCLLGGEPVFFVQPDSRKLEWARPEAREMISRYASFLAVPVVSGGQASGFLVFARTAASFNDTDVTAIGGLAAGTGTGINNVLTLLRQRSIADTLQQSLVAAEPRVPPGIEVAARCLPAAGQLVGGDWYDILALPAGRYGIIVGDVMGHGPEASAVMAQLRAAAHALAQLDLEPARLLTHLDRTAVTLRWPVLATCVYAIIDPAHQSCTLSAAGHLPPVLAMPDGATRVPDLPSGQSLGLGAPLYGQARITLPPGTVIALYTDGLVETRTRPFDQGISALCSALDGRHQKLAETCDTLIASLAERSEDDVTVVLARTPA